MSATDPDPTERATRPANSSRTSTRGSARSSDAEPLVSTRPTPFERLRGLLGTTATVIVLGVTVALAASIVLVVLIVVALTALA